MIQVKFRPAKFYAHFVSHHMPLYFLDTSVLNNEGNKPFTSIFERGSVKIWRTDANQGIQFSSQKKASCFLRFVLTCLHQQRSGAFLINRVSSCHLFFHLQYQIPKGPISFQLSVAERRQIL